MNNPPILNLGMTDLEYAALVARSSWPSTRMPLSKPEDRFGSQWLNLLPPWLDALLLPTVREMWRLIVKNPVKEWVTHLYWDSDDAVINTQA